MLLYPLLTHSVELHRKTPSRDASGGSVENYAVIPGSSSLRCCVQDGSGSATPQQGQRQVLITHSIYFAADPGWSRGMRFYWPLTGQYFTCHGVTDMGARMRVWWAQCVLVEA